MQRGGYPFPPKWRAALFLVLLLCDGGRFFSAKAGRLWLE
jgi:hypothetical protein